MAETPEPNKPDFRNEFPIRDSRDGSMISAGPTAKELVLSRRGDEFFAIGVHCTCRVFVHPIAGIRRPRSVDKCYAPRPDHRAAEANQCCSGAARICCSPMAIGILRLFLDGRKNCAAGEQ